MRSPLKDSCPNTRSRRDLTSPYTFKRTLSKGGSLPTGSLQTRTFLNCKDTIPEQGKYYTRGYTTYPRARSLEPSDRRIKSTPGPTVRSEPSVAETDRRRTVRSAQGSNRKKTTSRRIRSAQGPAGATRSPHTITPGPGAPHPSLVRNAFANQKEDWTVKVTYFAPQSTASSRSSTEFVVRPPWYGQRAAWSGVQSSGPQHF